MKALPWRTRSKNILAIVIHIEMASQIARGPLIQTQLRNTIFARMRNKLIFDYDEDRRTKDSSESCSQVVVQEM